MYVPIYFSKNTKYKIFGGKQGKFLGRGEREGRLSFTLSGICFFFSLRGASRLLYRVYVSVRIESWFEFYIANPNVFGDLYLFFVSYTEEKYIRIILTRIFSVNAPYCRIYRRNFALKLKLKLAIHPFSSYSKLIFYVYENLSMMYIYI